MNLKKYFCFAKSASLVLQELRLTILLCQKAGDSSVGLRLPQNDGVDLCFFENRKFRTPHAFCNLHSERTPFSVLCFQFSVFTSRLNRINHKFIAIETKPNITM